jgi:hypothetical protein
MKNGEEKFVVRSECTSCDNHVVDVTTIEGLHYLFDRRDEGTLNCKKCRIPASIKFGSMDKPSNDLKTERPT